MQMFHKMRTLKTVSTFCTNQDLYKNSRERFETLSAMCKISCLHNYVNKIYKFDPLEAVTTFRGR